MTTIAPTTPDRWLDAPPGARLLDGRVPTGPIQEKWDQHRFEMKLVNPANKRRFHVLVVGSGLAGASAAASLAELGYRVSCFCLPTVDSIRGPPNFGAGFPPIQAARVPLPCERGSA